STNSCARLADGATLDRVCAGLIVGSTTPRWSASAPSCAKLCRSFSLAHERFSLSRPRAGSHGLASAGIPDGRLQAVNLPRRSRGRVELGRGTFWQSATHAAGGVAHVTLAANCFLRIRRICRVARERDHRNDRAWGARAYHRAAYARDDSLVHA